MELEIMTKGSKRKAIGESATIGGVHKMPYSPARRAGDFVFISGQVPLDKNGEIVAGGVEMQTRQVMANLRAVLQEAGCDFRDVVKSTVFLADARDFWLFNPIYASYFDGTPPARSTVRSDLILDVKIEIEMIAHKPLK